MNVYVITVAITLSADDAVKDVNDLMEIYRSLGYIEEWEIVEELAT